MTARQRMTPHPEAVTPSDLIQRAAEIMRDLDVSFVPIVSDRRSIKLVGVIDRDIRSPNPHIPIVDSEIARAPRGWRTVLLNSGISAALVSTPAAAVRSERLMMASSR